MGLSLGMRLDQPAGAARSSDRFAGRSQTCTGRAQAGWTL